MAKIDVSVTRSLTINTGNYQSIRPTVTLTAREINADEASDVYLSLENALTGLIKLEIVSCASENKLVDSGLDRYCQDIIKRQAEIGEDIEKSLEKINSF